MGRIKAKRGARDQRSQTHISITDAAQVVQALTHLAGLVDDYGRHAPSLSPDYQQLGGVAHWMKKVWDENKIVLRLDPDFAAALFGSDTDVEIPEEWMQRLPFKAVACSLTSPLSLRDDIGMCHYFGFVVTGIRTEERPGGRVLGSGLELRNAWTTYHPFAGEAGRPCQGVRFLWFFQREGDPNPQAQTVSLIMDSRDTEKRTIASFIEGLKAVAAEQDYPWGAEYEVLVPLGVQILLYLAAETPDDLDWQAPERLARPNQTRDVAIGHVGWRVGAALRQWRQVGPSGRVEVGAGGGWRLPPHVRRAHWTRVRMATRDELGAVVGDRLGVQGVDWFYELRWIPPLLVNADRPEDLPTTTREVAT